MKVLDNVYYFHLEHNCWKPSMLISEVKSSGRFIVAGYGPSLHAKHILTEDEFIAKVDSKQLDAYTQKVRRYK